MKFKKITGVMMSAALAAAMVMPVMAADTNTVTITTDEMENTEDISALTKSIDITAGYEASTPTEDQVEANYYVVLKWTPNSTLKYTIGNDSYTWNVYDSANKKSSDEGFDGTAVKAGYEAKGTWSGSASVKVDIENWSNREVKANYTYADADGITSLNNIADLITTTVESAAKGVDVADKTTTSSAKTGTATFSITGITDGAISASNAKIGTLTVTLSK